MPDASVGRALGERVFAIRSALGTLRDPLPLREFAELLSATETAAGTKQYHASQISAWERGRGPKMTLEDVERLAAVDPKQRGRSWLAFGEPPTDRDARFLADVDAASAPALAAETETAAKKAAAKKSGHRKRA